MPGLLATKLAMQIATGQSTMDNLPPGLKKDVSVAMGVLGLGPNVKNTDQYDTNKN